MTKPLLCLLVMLAALPATAGAQVSSPFDCEDQGASRVTRAGGLKALPQEIVEVPSKLDGRALQIGLVRPDTDRPAPVILHASPYNARDLAETDLNRCASFLVENFVQHGYAVALFSVRGGGDTDGCANMFGAKERSDLDDVLTWLGTQPWSSGRAGMIGISYSGSTPWVAAASGNPYLETIVPEAGVTDVFDLAFSAGTLDSRSQLFAPLYYLQYGAALNNPVVSGRDPQRTVNAVADCDDLMAGVEAGARSAVTSARTPYWTERNQRPLVAERYRGSVLHVQGLTDWNVRPQHTIAWAESLRKHGIRVRHLLGQWHHQYPDTEGSPHSRWDYADRLLDWFDHELKRRGGRLGPRVEVEDDSGRWRRAKRLPWKPNRTLTLGKELRGELGALLAPDARSRFYYASQDFPGHNTDIEAATVDDLCATCAVFVLPVEQKPLRFAGRPALDVTVTPVGNAGHVTAFLYRRNADGLRRVGWGMTDLRFPAGENAGGEAAATVTPGVPLDVRVDFEPLDVVIAPGDELVLILGQGRTGQIPAQPPLPVQLTAGTLKLAEHDQRRFFTPPPQP